ncbi:MAG: hypothetical protein ABI761_15440 [Saprospiraceae bacterium]
MITPELKNKLIEWQAREINFMAFVGFDGYVDFIQKAVKTNSKEEKVYFQTLHELGAHITNAAGKSAQVELSTQVKKLGGNGPIMANALASLGISNYCAGTMGYPVIHEVFKEMHPRCHLLSLTEPGISNALEFEDGKLILSELSAFDQLDFSFIQQRHGANYLDEALQKSKLISMVDWANLPLCTSMWAQLFEHLKSLLTDQKIFFFDLCDPSKKTSQEIQEVLDVISQFKVLGTTIMGLNENEARKVFKALSGEKSSDNDYDDFLPSDDLQKISEYIFKKMQIDALMVHPVDRTILVTPGDSYMQSGKVITHPKLLTGGGDNLNAGFCFGLLLGCTWEESMELGMATSGAYVQNGVSPDIDTLIAFMEI